jgi:hypothetical protein
VAWAGRHSLTLKPYVNKGEYKIEQYFITGIDSIDFERDIIVNPQITSRELKKPVSAGEYYFLPAAQLKGNMIVLALEPKSMLGLPTYKNFAHLLKQGEVFPVLRVMKNR